MGGGGDVGDLPDGSLLFVGGYPRSGTTFLGRCLGTHPQIAYWEEPRLLSVLARLERPFDRLAGHLLVDARADLMRSPRDQNLRGALEGDVEPAADERDRLVDTAMLDVLSSWRRNFLERSAGWVLLDKTPMDVTRFGWAADRLEPASFVHIVRDVRDVVCSVRDWERRRGRPGWLPDGEGGLVRQVAEHWVGVVGDALQAEASRPGRIHRVRYEELLGEPGRTLAGALATVGLDYDPALDGFLASGMDGLDRASVGRWRRELDHEELEEVTRVAGPTLERLGYELERASGPRPPVARTRPPRSGARAAGPGRERGPAGTAAPGPAPSPELVERLARELVDARRTSAELRQRVRRLRRRRRRLTESERAARAEIARLERELEALRASTTWRVGRVVTRVPGRLRRGLRRRR